MFEIGNSLREARARQQLDYSQVELATKIRAKYIRALEEEQFDVLPGATYIRGFLRSYAEFLGLDGQLYVDEYNSRTIADGFDDMPQRRPHIRQERSLERKVVLLALAGIAALTALVIVAWKFGGGDASNSTPAVVTQQQRPQIVASVLRYRGVGKGTYLEIWKQPWVGAPDWNGTLLRGEHQKVLGKRFWICIRRSTGVRFELNGNPVSLPARRNLRVLVTPSKTVKLPSRRCT
jgi:helix-turn-helix protein